MRSPASPRPSVDVQYHQQQHGPKRPRGRGIWAISGVIVIGAMSAFVGAALSQPRAIHALPMDTRTRTLAISEPFSHLSLQSYGGNVQVIGGSSTRVTEQVDYDPQQGPAPAVIDSVSDGQLSLDVPSCASQDCQVGFTVTVPSTVSVTAVTNGGNVAISNVAGATIDSGSGAVIASSVHGPLTATSEGGNQSLLNVDGVLNTDSGGGNVVVQGLTAVSAIITTDGGQLAASGVAAQTIAVNSDGGDARVVFASAPVTADVTTDGGNAAVLVPRGPFALTADSDGGPEVVAVATSPSARATLTVVTGGGNLVVDPATGSSGKIRAGASYRADRHVLPIAPLAPLAPPAPAAS